MIYTFNSCSYSQLRVLPANWQTNKSAIEKNWLIFYRFYDPACKDKYPNGLQVGIRGMNRCKEIAKRREITLLLIKDELDALNREGYNPITKTYMCELPARRPEDEEIGPDMLYLDALKMVLSKSTLGQKTRADVRSVLKFFAQSADNLGKGALPIKDLKRKEIRLILDNCKNIKKIWTDNLFNHYRKYLGMLFSELMEMEIVDYNPIDGIRKRQTVTKMVEILSREQAAIVDERLKKHPAFRRFVHIFFHSGTRISELMQVKKSDVDMIGQRFLITIKKGHNKREAWKTIKDVALPFWQEIMGLAADKDYIFSKGLVPGPVAINSDQVTRRWKIHIKKPLGISINFYSNKHRHTTMVSNLLGEIEAARHNDHLGTDMVEKVYNVEHVLQKHNRVKGLDNSFTD